MGHIKKTLSLLVFKIIFQLTSISFIAFGIFFFLFSLAIPLLDVMFSYDLLPANILDENYSPRGYESLVEHFLKNILYGIAFYSIGIQFSLWAESGKSIDTTAKSFS